jgi:DNA-binding NarL/FixJ family response regulator
VSTGQVQAAGDVRARKLDFPFGAESELAEPAGFDALTSREREILIEVAASLSNAEIAAKLFLAEATVKTHVGRMLNKLQLRDRVQAVVYAYEHGLVRPGSRP